MIQESLFAHWKKILDEQLSVLPDKSEENTDNTLRALWLAASGTKVSAMSAIRHELADLDDSQIVILEKLIEERLSGVPLAHLTERQNFMNLDYILTKGIYIPRRETEILAKSAIKLIDKKFSNQDNLTVIDICTGIGTVALAIGSYCKNTTVYGSDIFEPAIQFAQINTAHFKLKSRAKFYHADLFSPFYDEGLSGTTDIIVSAPPYITSAKVPQMAEEIARHEPKEAFDAGPFGFSIFNKLIAESPVFLKSGGYLLIECGLGQGDFIAKRLNDNGNYEEIDKICDESGNVRVIVGKKK